MNTVKTLHAPPPGFYQIAIADYILDHHSDNLSEGQTRADVSFHIGAPNNLVPQDDAMHLFLDPANHVTRQLSGDAWQIHCEDSVTENGFHLWAQQTVQLMLEAMLGKNMMGFEFVGEVRNLLRQTKGEYIVARHVPLNQAEQLSQRLADSSIQDAWLALFSHAPSMEMCSHVITVFQDHVPDEGGLLSSVNTLGKGADCLMVLTTHTR